MATSRTFVFLKPDAVKRGLTGQIISRFELKGFRIVRMEMMTPPREHFEKHYEEHRNKEFFGRTIEYVLSGDVLAMVLEGPVGCWETVRNMIGSTFPENASAGTIRGDLGTHKPYNVIHGSDSQKSADREIALWFGGNK